MAQVPAVDEGGHGETALGFLGFRSGVPWGSLRMDTYVRVGPFRLGEQWLCVVWTGFVATRSPLGPEAVLWSPSAILINRWVFVAARFSSLAAEFGSLSDSGRSFDEKHVLFHLFF